jgi:hypothetical protein
MTSIEGQRVRKGQQTTDDQVKCIWKKLKFRFNRVLSFTVGPHYKSLGIAF